MQRCGFYICEIHASHFHGLLYAGPWGCTLRPISWVLLYVCVCACVCVCVHVMCAHAHSLSCIQLFCNPMDYSPPASSVDVILQAKILECIFFTRGSSTPMDWTYISCISCIGRGILYHCTTWEAWVLSSSLVYNSGAHYSFLSSPPKQHTHTHTHTHSKWIFKVLDHCGSNTLLEGLHWESSAEEDSPSGMFHSIQASFYKQMHQGNKITPCLTEGTLRPYNLIVSPSQGHLTPHLHPAHSCPAVQSHPLSSSCG